MRTFQQITTLTMLNLSNVPRRLGLSLVTMVGIGTVVGVLISFLALGAGVNQMATRNVRSDRVVVLSSGASSSLPSALSREAIATITDAPGIKQDSDGRPLMVSGIMVSVGRGLLDTTLIIGADAKFNAVFPEFRVVEGRMFTPGVREIVVGKLAGSQFERVRIGERIALRGSQWTVVGRFEQNGGTWENHAVADAETMMFSFERN